MRGTLWDELSISAGRASSPRRISSSVCRGEKFSTIVLIISTVLNILMRELET